MWLPERVRSIANRIEFIYIVLDTKMPPNRPDLAQSIGGSPFDLIGRFVDIS